MIEIHCIEMTAILLFVVVSLQGFRLSIPQAASANQNATNSILHVKLENRLHVWPTHYSTVMEQKTDGCQTKLSK